MDDLGMLLERIATSQTARVVVPPPRMIIDKSRRRATARMVASSAVVMAMVVAFMLMLAGVSLAGETGSHSGDLAFAATSAR